MDLDSPDEVLASHLDRLESVLAQKDAELQRIRSELDLKVLYAKELHALLERQTRQLEELERRIRLLEPASKTPFLVRIRLKKPL